MYALVKGQQLLLGPVGFNYRMINSVLEDELELVERVYSNDAQRVPFTIVDDVQILPARYEDSFAEFDPRFEERTGPIHTIYQQEVVFSYSKREKPLEQIKAERKIEIAPIRREKENGTISTTIGGTEIVVSISRENRLVLASKLTGGDGPYNFKFENNTWAEVTKSDIESILLQIDIKVQEAFDWELAKNQEIDACETKEAVYEVVIREPLPEVGANLINVPGL
jgi:hypothetical protein